MKRILLFFLLSGVGLALNAQDQFYHSYHGIWATRGEGAIPLSDGGYFVYGNGRYDTDSVEKFVAFRTNSDRSIRWKYYYDCTGVSCQATCALALPDGSFLLADEFSNILKIDSVGNLLWSKRTYISPSGLLFMALLPSGEIAFAARRNWSVVLAKFTDLGQITMTKVYYRTVLAPVYPRGIETLQNGDFLIFGRKETSPGEPWVMRVDAQGVPKWGNRYLPSQPGGEIYDALEADNGNIMLYGNKASNPGVSPMLLCIDSTGTLLWNKTYQGSDPRAKSHQIMHKPNGYLLTSTYGNVYNPGHDSYNLIRVDDYGNVLWSRTNSVGGVNDQLQVRETTDGGYLLSGWRSGFNIPNFTVTDLIKTDSLGNVGCFDADYPLVVDSTLVFTRAPYIHMDSSYPNSFIDVQYTIRNIDIQDSLVCGLVATDPAAEAPTFSLSPNPANDRVRISRTGPANGDAEVSVWDFMGRQLKTHTLPADREALLMEVGDLSAGTYLVRIQNAGTMRTMKLVKR